ncbi:metallopeptidase family protein [Erythrobacter sp. EC-HK427]|uniref:metallopeptidase family protein n=1 Tax=Erythrobacter sp. EC-HK427 TaxID=2038396 RepID=UPI001253D120|nr:metallopeptidase family protein [Erythrobacter sp. EC-HK427]VVT10245.1 Neutral zinc metallopeptidase [Erythrobacter sp. EC-HK427]
MTRTIALAPSIAEMQATAEAALRQLPSAFAARLGDIVLVVEDWPDEETLAELGIDNHYELTGVYEGLPLTERSIEHSGTLPDRVRLFRRPILDEWAERGDETLEHLVAHVVVHEIGHHFGLSDEDMHALEEMVG